MSMKALTFDEQLKEASNEICEARFDPNQFCFEQTEHGVRVKRQTLDKVDHYLGHTGFWVNEFRMALRSGKFGSA